MKWLSLVFIGLSTMARAQTVVVGDALVSGRIGVGGAPGSARVKVAMSTTAVTQFQVSGVDETPFLTVPSSGAVGLGVTPSAAMDISGSGDSGAMTLGLDNGNAAAGGAQLAFGYKGSANLRHS